MICFTVFAPFASNFAGCGAWCVMVLFQVATGFANNVPLWGGFQESPSGLALNNGTSIVLMPWIGSERHSFRKPFARLKKPLENDPAPFLVPFFIFQRNLLLVNVHSVLT